MSPLPKTHVSSLQRTAGVFSAKGSTGSQDEFVRIPYAETSLYPIPAGADEEAFVMLSNILSTGCECGVLNGKIQPRGSVAIVGSRSPSRSLG